jgi:hypothetical protein
MMADRYAPAPKPRSPTRRDALKKIVLRLPTWSGQFWLSWPGCLAFTYGRILRLAARSARNSSRSSMIYSALLHPKAIAYGRLNFKLRHYPSVGVTLRRERRWTSAAGKTGNRLGCIT